MIQMLTVKDVRAALTNFPDDIIVELRIKNYNGTWCVAHLDHITTTRTGSPLLSCYEQDAPKTATARNKLLHALWGKAVGTSDYDKSQWQELQKLLE